MYVWVAHIGAHRHCRQIIFLASLFYFHWPYYNNNIFFMRHDPVYKDYFLINRFGWGKVVKAAHIRCVSTLIACIDPVYHIICNENHKPCAIFHCAQYFIVYPQFSLSFSFSQNVSLHCAEIIVCVCVRFFLV